MEKWFRVKVVLIADLTVGGSTKVPLKTVIKRIFSPSELNCSWSRWQRDWTAHDQDDKKLNCSWSRWQRGWTVQDQGDKGTELLMIKLTKGLKNVTREKGYTYKHHSNTIYCKSLGYNMVWRWIKKYADYVENDHWPYAVLIGYHIRLVTTNTDSAFDPCTSVIKNLWYT